MLLHTAASQQRRGAAAGATPPPHRPAGAAAAAPRWRACPQKGQRASRDPRVDGGGARPDAAAAAVAQRPRVPPRATAAAAGTRRHGWHDARRGPAAARTHRGGWLPPASTPCVRRSRTPWRASGPHHHKRSSEGIDTQGNSSKPDQGTRAGKPERATRSNAGSRGKRKKQVQTRNSSRQVAPSQPRGMHGRQANRWQHIEALAGTGSMASGN